MVDFFSVFLLLVSICAGSVAALAGFGIGSLVTPLLSLKTGTGLAIAAVSIVHFLGTAFRFWIWKSYINKKILYSFGLTSAIGGFVGALLHNVLFNFLLTIIFACLLIFAGITGLVGVSQRWKLKGRAAWIAGALSGVFGGLVGNQGGIRSVAMMGFSDLKGKEFVATATGIALAVDVVRMPVYFVSQFYEILNIWPLIMISAFGVLIGTEIGIRILTGVSESLFKRVISGIILLIGLFVLIFR